MYRDQQTLDARSRELYDVLLGPRDPQSALSECFRGLNILGHNVRMSDLPIVCTLSPAALKARRENLLAVLLRRAKDHHELAEGYNLRFAAEGDILAAIAHTIDAERQCCRFLRFRVTVEPDGGLISLDLDGPAGTREFLAAMLDL